MKKHWIFSTPHIRHFHSAFFRGLRALAVVLALTGSGTACIRYLERMTWTDSFYFVSMLVTAQGPAMMPETMAGKLFAAIFSYIAVGVGLTAIGYIFGPFAADLWKSILTDHQKGESLRNKS